MQRCPYIHEMKERLLGEQMPMEPLIKDKEVPKPVHHMPEQQQPVGTVVRLNADGYSTNTSPAHQRTPLMSQEPEEEFQCVQQTSWRPKNAKTSLFIITSFIYAKLLIVICIAYVISDVVTHNLPLYYYEGFFTYLYGMSILFLLYVFCFLLQESTCCSGDDTKEKKVKKPPPEKKEKDKKEKDKKEKEKKEKEKKEKEKKEKEKKEEKSKDKDKDKDKDVAKKNKKQGQFQSTYRRNSEGAVDAGLLVVPVPVAELGNAQGDGVVPQEPPPPVPPQPLPVAHVDVEAGRPVVTASTAPPSTRKRKTTQNDQSHGSFFLRVGAIAFGLGTMIYNGLEFGSFFEVPFTSPCYQILRGVNPVLQMIFTFMQMYFIFMNSRLNIHRFKVIARFGLMHVVATNICVWIRTLVLEYLKEITTYHKKNITAAEDHGLLGESIRSHILRSSGLDMPTHEPATTASSLLTSSTARISAGTLASTTLRALTTTVRTTTALPSTISSTIKSTTMRTYPTWEALKSTLPTTIPTTTTTTTTTTPLPTTTTPTTTTEFTTFMTTTPFRRLIDFENYNNFDSSFLEDADEIPIAAINEDTSNSILDDTINNIVNNNFSAILPQALTSSNDTDILPASCGRINIMGTIVQDSAPYLFPFIIEYSLIGAAVIYVMWKHIGRNPSRYVTEEDLEHRLEVMLSRRAVAMAHAQHGRVDCVGASKGLFFGLLLLVGSLICLILFFVLIRHPDLSLLAIYLADVSHCVLMVLSIVAIIIGFIRVQNLKFRTEEQSDLNDILLRVSAFGLFIYAVFSVIAGSLAAFTHEPNLLVMITGLLSIVQVVLQLLFIADVSRRRVHLPEHDRSKPGRQVVTFLLICNVTMWIIYTFETQKVEANPVQLDFYGFLAWALVQRFTLPLCIFHRFHSAVTLAEIWKTSYKARLE